MSNFDFDDISEYVDAEVMLNRILDGKYIYAVTIWKNSKGWLGSFSDPLAKVISGSTPWKEQPSLEALLTKLLKMADVYRTDKSSV